MEEIRLILGCSVLDSDSHMVRYGEEEHILPIGKAKKMEGKCVKY